MISSLRGTVIDKGLDYVEIECAGVGYRCSATAETIAHLPRGEEALVYTTLVVREDSQTLYAFASPEERTTFSVLQTVSGVGARVALAIMSVLRPEALAAAVRAGDAKTLQKAPGVGKRLAERMAVDLKDKMPSFGAEDAQAGGGDSSTQMELVPADVHERITEALVGLGFTEAKAASALASVAKTVPEGQARDSSALLRATLKHLGGQR